jgi:ClpP class serine protease
MFDARTAKQIGLIDSVGTLSTAINKVAELARVSSINKTAKEIAHV